MKLLFLGGQSAHAVTDVFGHGQSREKCVILGEKTDSTTLWGMKMPVLVVNPGFLGEANDRVSGSFEPSDGAENCCLTGTRRTEEDSHGRFAPPVRRAPPATGRPPHDSGAATHQTWSVLRLPSCRALPGFSVSDRRPRSP